MNIGDKVRVIRGTEEGIVVGFLPQDMVEIEIEDGFEIPVQKKDLVVISSVEKEYFSKGKTTADLKKETSFVSNSIERKTSLSKGIYISFIPFGKQNYDLFIVNDTSFELSYRIMEYHDSSFKGIGLGILKAHAHSKFATKTTNDFEAWPVMVVDILYFKDSFFSQTEVLNKRVKPKANLFQKKTLIPVINKDGFKIQLDQFEVKVDPQMIKEKMENNKVLEAFQETENMSFKSLTLDLHAEVQGFKADENQTILDQQLALFQQFLDKAILSGNSEVTFIHGVGNGILRKEIHKALSGHPHVAYFKDADKGKFGYGSTIAKIK